MLVSILTSKVIWLSVATLVAALAVRRQFRGSRSWFRSLRTAGLLSAGLGALFTVAAIGHFVAISLKALSGTLPATVSLAFVVPFGLAMLVPGLILWSHACKLNDARTIRAALGITSVLTLTLLSQAPPLAALTGLSVVLLFRAFLDILEPMPARTSS